MKRLVLAVMVIVAYLIALFYFVMGSAAFGNDVTAWPWLTVASLFFIGTVVLIVRAAR